MLDLDKLRRESEERQAATDKAISEVVALALEEWRALYPAYMRIRRVAIALDRLSTTLDRPIPETESQQIAQLLALRPHKARKPWTRRAGSPAENKK